MKKAIFSICSALIISIMPFFASAGAVFAKPLEIMVAYSNQPGEPVDQAVHYWARILEKESGGQIKLKPFPSGQLGGEVVVAQQAKMGAPIIAISSYGALADLIPDLGVINAPYVGSNVAQKITLVHSKPFTSLIDALQPKGFHVVVPDFYYGTRELLAKRRATKPEAMNGVKIRVQNAKIARYWASSIGAVATPMPLSEAYTALSQGIVAGIENPVATLYGGRFYEQAKYLVMTNHDIHITPWIVGSAFWNTLSKEQQQLIRTTGRDMSAYGSELIQTTEKEYIEKLIAAGVEVIEVDMGPYVENAKKVMQGAFPEWSSGLYEKTMNSLD